MSRALVSKKILVALINEEMQKFEASQGCEIIGEIQELISPLADGGNWSRSIAIGGRPKNPQACGEAAHDIVVRIAQSYNLET